MGAGDVSKRILLGRKLRSSQLGETLLPKRIALPVFASDALSSVAYAPDEVRRETAGMSPVAAAKSIVVLQVVFNVLLFLPWGIFARGFAGWAVVRSTVTAALASLLIEVTQYTGVFGLIGCSYRIGDVDDLITNTLGGLRGALAAPLVMRGMPRPADPAGSPAPGRSLRP